MEDGETQDGETEDGQVTGAVLVCARMRAGEDMKLLLGLIAALFAAVAGISAQTDGRKILSVDHTVTVKSTVPAIAGQPAQIYVLSLIHI